MTNKNILKFKGQDKFESEIKDNNNGIKNMIIKIHEFAKLEDSVNAIENLQSYILKLQQRNEQLERNINGIWS